MGVEVEGVEELAFLLRQSGARAVKGAFQQMKKEGEAIARRARENAPVDEGDLEKAIRSRVVGGGRDEETGQFKRKEIVIEVDGDATTSDGKSVGSYAYIMHEELKPYGFGRFNLGPKSRAKQENNPSFKVGGMYLERAIAEIEKGMMNRIIEAVRDAVDDDF